MRRHPDGPVEPNDVERHARTTYDEMDDIADELAGPKPGSGATWGSPARMSILTSGSGSRLGRVADGPRRHLTSL